VDLAALIWPAEESKNRFPARLGMTNICV